MKTAVAGRFIRALRFLRDSRALATLVILVVIMNMLVAASVAWFTMNRQTDADDIGMSLSFDDTTALYEAYMYDLETEKGTNKAPDGSELTIGNLVLNQYDTIFKAQNRYTPAFARIEITRIHSMPESGNVTITIARNKELGADDAMSAYSSSITRFTAFIIQDKGDNDPALLSDPAAFYDYISPRSRFNEIEDLSGAHAHSKTFVNVIGEGDSHTHEKLDDITLTLPYEAKNWYRDADGDNVMNVYLYITYDVQLIDCYMDKQEPASGGISLDDNGVTFENDFKKVTVGYTD